MRIFGLLLLGLLAYLVSLVVMFPANYLVERFKPQISLVNIQGASGKIYKGQVDRISSTDDLLPLEVTNFSWALDPASVLQGGVGVDFGFDAYGGSGKGNLLQVWQGATELRDFDLEVQAQQLEPLLPVPIASFGGRLQISIDRLTLVDNLLNEMHSTLRWVEAELRSPVPTALGTVDVTIRPQANQIHLITLLASGGDVTMDGQVTLTLNGDFNADVLFTPTASASADVRAGLRQMGRADPQGRVRFQRQGNVNRLM